MADITPATSQRYNRFEFSVTLYFTLAFGLNLALV